MIYSFNIAILNDATSTFPIDGIDIYSSKNSLVKSYEEDLHKKIHVIAAQKISDQEILKRIVQVRRIDSEVKAAAAAKISDKDAIAEAAFKNRDAYVRRAAVLKIKNQDQLMKIAAEDEDQQVRIAAMKKINDLQFLNKVSVTAKSKTVRLVAVNKISAQNILIKVAKNDPDADVRKAAAKKIKNQQKLYSILKNEKNLHVRTAAIEQIDQQSLLYRIAKTDKNEIARLVSITKLSSEKSLFEIARTDSHRVVREAAVNKLNDVNMLIQIAQSDEIDQIRLSAARKIYQLDYGNENIVLDDHPAELMLMLLARLIYERHGLLRLIVDARATTAKYFNFNRLTTTDYTIEIQNSNGLKLFEGFYETMNPQTKEKFTVGISHKRREAVIDLDKISTTLLGQYAHYELPEYRIRSGGHKRATSDGRWDLLGGEPYIGRYKILRLINCN